MAMETVGAMEAPMMMELSLSSCGRPPPSRAAAVAAAARRNATRRAARSLALARREAAQRGPSHSSRARAWGVARLLPAEGALRHPRPGCHQASRSQSVGEHVRRRGVVAHAQTSERTDPGSGADRGGQGCRGRPQPLIPIHYSPAQSIARGPYRRVAAAAGSATSRYRRKAPKRRNHPRPARHAKASSLLLLLMVLFTLLLLLLRPIATAPTPLIGASLTLVAPPGVCDGDSVVGFALSPL